MSKQETFDICMGIIFAAILLAISAWIAVDSTEKPCKEVYPYSNTLQKDINRNRKCR